MSDDKLFNVLFLCTGNSARSIMGECILNRLGRGWFRAFSAGSHPKGEINPHTIETLKKLNYVTDDLRSKSWDEFAVPGAPELQFVITVCDQAAQEVCPLWPGQPMSAHWGIPDPAAVEGNEAEQRIAFANAYVEQPDLDFREPAHGLSRSVDAAAASGRNRPARETA